MAIMRGTKIVQNEVHRNYAEWILVFFKLYYRLLLTPFQIKYDENSGGFYKCSEGSKSAKFGFIVCHCTIAIYTLWGATVSTMHDNSASAIMNGLYKLSYLLFGVFNVVWFIFMWKQVPIIPDLLNKGNALFSALIHDDYDDNSIEYIPETKPKSRLSKHMQWPGMIFIVIFTIISTLSFYTQGILNNDNGSIAPDMFVNHVVNHTIASFCRIHQYWCTLMIDDLSEQHSLAAYVTASVWIFITIFAELSWQIVFFMMIIWGFYFRKMFQLGLKRISDSATNADMFKAIQMFSRITILLDEWNEMFGTILLVNFVNILVYKCVGFAQSMASEVGWQATIIMTCTLIPNFVMLYFMGDVHRVGCSVSGIFKQKYIVQKRFEEPLPLDIFHASCILHHDILANTVAFKGQGFFTVSFQFVGSLIGIITTYTLVTVQLTSVK